MGYANKNNVIMKPILLALAATVAAGPAIAGPYTKSKSEFFGQGDTYHRSVNQARVGYEKDAGDWKPYVEIGGGIVTPDSEDSLYLFAVQVGTSVDITDKLSGYVFVENMHYDEKNNWKGQIGTKYTF